MKVIDQQALDSAKILDLAKPPVKEVPYAEYPRMVYRHPKDKSREHLTKIVKDQAELDAAIKEGWRKEPHIPVIPPPEVSDDFEGAPKQEAPKQDKK